MIFRSIAAAVLTATVAFSAHAQSGAEGVFTVTNVTESHTVNNFYTSEDGETWSESWLDETSVLEPGESATASFFAESGPCEQYFIVAWMGEDGTEVQDDPVSIDICEATNVYLGDNEVWFD